VNQFQVLEEEMKEEALADTEMKDQML